MIVATQPRRSLAVCLVTGAFLVPLMFFHHVVNNVPRPTGDVVVHEESRDSDLGGGFSPADSPVVASPMRLTTNEMSLDACGMGHADACPFAHVWAPDAAVAPLMRLTINEMSLDACGMGHADACPFAHVWAPVR
jgi:hypothetical protein